jgi:hypothetical protein
VLGDIQWVLIGRAVALRRVADPLVAGVRQPLQIRLPADARMVQLADQAGLAERVQVVRVVVGHPEHVAAEQPHVVGLAGVREAVVVGREAVPLGQRIEIWGRGVADHVGEAVVLLDHHEDVVVARHR